MHRFLKLPLLLVAIATTAFAAGPDEAAAKSIQDLYLSGKKEEAAAAVPDELVDEVALCGPKERIRERLEAWKSSGVTTMICGVSKVESLRLMAELVL